MAFRIYSAGQLTQQVQFMRRAGPARSPLGTPTAVWEPDGGPSFAACQPLRGDERNAAQASTKLATMVVVVRHNANRTPERMKAEGLRLTWRGLAWEILDALRVDGGNEWSEVYVKEAGTTA